MARMRGARVLAAGVVLALGGLAATTGGPSRAGERARAAHEARGEALRLYAAGRDAEALPWFDTVLAREPRDIECRNKRGCIYLRMNQPERALADFDEAARVSPFLANDTINSLQQFIPDVQLGLSAKAVAPAFTYAPAVTNRGVALLMLGRDEEALAEFRRAISIHQAQAGLAGSTSWGAGMASSLCGMGQVSYRRGDYLAAFDAYDRAGNYNPDDPNALLGRGLALSGLDRHEEALASLDAALRLAPRHARAHAARATVLDHLDRAAEATEEYADAVRLAPGDATIATLRASALARRGLQREAVDTLDAARSRMPGEPSLLAARGGLLARQGALPEALRNLDEALRNDPSSARAWQNRAGVLNEMGRHADAIRDASEAIRLDPRRAGAWSNRGLARSRLGDTVSALLDLDEAVRLDGALPAARVNRAGVYAQLGRLDEAANDYEEALRLAPRLPQAEVGLKSVYTRMEQPGGDVGPFAAHRPDPDSLAGRREGDALRARGDWPAALAAYDRAVERDPRHADALALRAWARHATNTAGARADIAGWFNLRGWRDPFAPYMAILGHLAARSGPDSDPSEASRWLVEATANTRPDAWPAPVFRYLKRTLSATDLVAAAPNADARADAETVVGLDRILGGQPTAAREALERARDLAPQGSLARDVATETLRRVELGHPRPQP